MLMAMRYLKGEQGQIKGIQRQIRGDLRTMAIMNEFAQLVKEKENDAGMVKLRDRMDADLDMYHMVKYEMKDWKQKIVKAVDNITLPKPKYFADRVISVMNVAPPRVQIAGKGLSDSDTSVIEKFWDYAIYQANEHLFDKMIIPLDPFLTFQSVIRGWLGVRVVVWQDGEKVRFDIVPWDMRSVLWESGDDGLIWVANKTDRTKKQIETEYGEDAAGKGKTVTDFWDREQNVVMVGNEIVKQQSHNYGRPPVAISPVTMTPLVPTRGGDQLMYHGESVFSTNRGIYPEMNKIVSILQTLNALSFRMPVGYVSDDGTKLPEDYPYIAATMIAMAKGEKWEGLPVGDISKSGPFLWEILQSEEQKGALPTVEYGDTPFPLSGIALEKLSQQRDPIFLPRLQAKGVVYEQIARMLISQFRDGGFKAEIGEEGDVVQVQAGQLAKDFTIKFKMAVQWPEKKLLSYSVAAAAAPFLDSDTIRREILEVEDPSEVERKLLDDMVIQAVPEVGLYRMAKALIEQAKEMSKEEKQAKYSEAKLIMRKLGMSKQEIASEIGERKPKGKVAKEMEVGMPEAKVEMPGGQMAGEEKLQRGQMRQQGSPTEGA